MQSNTNPDPRAEKAIAIALGASQWFKCRVADGSKRYGVPSTRQAWVYHLASQTSCTCYDAEHHVAPCKHQLAVRLVCQAAHQGISIQELVSQPAAIVNDGLAEMVAEHNPTLTMVRHADGEISWERREQERLSARYEEIFTRFDDETPEQIFGRL